MNGEKYQQIPEDQLLPFIVMHRSTHFLQDGTPFHTSKRIEDFLKDKPFEVTDWPVDCPDFNPIENAWNFMKNKLTTEDISSVPKLKGAILKIWTQNISREYLSSLRNSMPRMMEAIIKNRGDMSKYKYKS
jgi:transposase